MQRPIVCTLQRTEKSDDGTFGVFESKELDFRCLSLELPDRQNTPYRSRVLAGEYLVKWQESLKKKRSLYRLEDKNGRVGILIHSGSFGGDTEKGRLSDLMGCIALGESTALMINKLGGRQTILTSSRDAIHHFETRANMRPLILRIINEEGGQ